MFIVTNFITNFITIIKHICKYIYKNLISGIKDSCNWIKVYKIIEKNIQIQKTIKNIIYLNVISIGLNIFTNVILNQIKIISNNIIVYDISNLILLYLLSIPFYVIAIILNLIYITDIVNLLDNQNINISTNQKFYNLFLLKSSSIHRILLIPGLTIQQYIILKIPYIGNLLYFINNCLIYAFYQFEYYWNKNNILITEQTDYIERNIIYFIGFGFQITLVTHILSLYNINYFIIDAIFSMLFPFYVIIASFTVTNKNLSIFKIPYFNPIVKIGPFIINKFLELLNK